MLEILTSNQQSYEVFGRDCAALTFTLSYAYSRRKKILGYLKNCIMNPPNSDPIKFGNRSTTNEQHVDRIFLIQLHSHARLQHQHRHHHPPPGAHSDVLRRCQQMDLVGVDAELDTFARALLDEC
ncbi:hypothetical protein EYC84_003473 [Monilinia fructicola]|uniref:Uncharacterized protein n=1 Tax=Monilinia fructicola TaxID=38448 RepID=A0A5M9JYX8_MONFR|nr:hypothetical protein EYC84_003473 [Monilinia fructicola]